MGRGRAGPSGVGADHLLDAIAEVDHRRLEERYLLGEDGEVAAPAGGGVVATLPMGRGRGAHEKATPISAALTASWGTP